MTLKDAAVGSKVKVVKIEGQGAVKRRILDMGITKGIEILIRKVAPLGDPVEVLSLIHISRLLERNLLITYN